MARLQCVLSLLLAAAAALDTPEYVKPCHRSDPNLNECIKNSLNHLRTYLVKGIGELDLPPLEPLVFPRLSMENGNGPVRVRAAFTNITIHGASEYSIINVRSDIKNWRIDLGLALPRIESTGRYEVVGNVLLFPVRSRGDFAAIFQDIVAVAKIAAKEVVVNGETYLKIDRFGVDFSLSKSRFRIKDLLNGNNVLGEAMNQFLNQNANEIIKEMKPAASQSIARVFREYLNGALAKLPLSVFLLD